MNLRRPRLGGRLPPAALAAGALLLGCCGTPDVDRPDGGWSLGDRVPLEPPPTPRVEPVATPAPYEVATLRGRAPGAVRILVDGVDNPPVRRVLGDGSFCVDVPLPRPGDYTLRVRAQAENGALSAPSDPVQVTFDPAAPRVPGAAMCNGADPAGCSGSEETCGNGYDDDCNGLVDDEDPACRSCEDDLFEPNGTGSAPRIEPGRHERLVLCPGDEDRYGLYLFAGEQALVRIFFAHAQGDLGLQLLDASGAVLAESRTDTDDERVEWTAEEDGEVTVRVWLEGSGGPVDYVLDARVTASAG